VRQPTFLLEVLASQTALPATMPLTAVEVRLGRAAAHADVIFAADPTVSRLHATMVREGNSYRLFDEQSTSGTFVNGQPAPSYGALLIDGDEVHLGEVHLRFRMSEG
jgi:pSer/pThr/pTyr-binding forkhead associated (FHA) protein